MKRLGGRQAGRSSALAKLVQPKSEAAACLLTVQCSASTRGPLCTVRDRERVLHPLMCFGTTPPHTNHVMLRQPPATEGMLSHPHMCT